MSLLNERPTTSTSWITSILRNISSAILCKGPIPRHVAFIMDGNRRWAREQSMAPFEGHHFGFNKLKEALDWCLDIGITIVTVYAFSLENFKRPREEVDELFSLATVKFGELLNNKELIHKHEVSIRVLGDISLLPDELQRAIGKAVNSTKNYDKAILNVCFSYTSRDEMTCSLKRLARGVEEGDIFATDISEEAFESCLYTDDNPDLLIRTSGEKRFSDFLLWQSSVSIVVFMDVLWPDFSPWDLYYAIIQYQKNHKRAVSRKAILKKQKDIFASSLLEDHEGDKEATERVERVQRFMKKVQKEREFFFEELHLG